MESDGQMVGDMAVPSQNLYSNIQVGSMRLVARSDGAASDLRDSDNVSITKR